MLVAIELTCSVSSRCEVGFSGRLVLLKLVLRFDLWLLDPRIFVDTSSPLLLLLLIMFYTWSCRSLSSLFGFNIAVVGHSLTTLDIGHLKIK